MDSFFPYHHHDDLGGLFRVPAGTVQQRDAAMEVVRDEVGDFLVVFRHDEYLRRLFVAREHHVGGYAECGRQYVTRISPVRGCVR